jgi:hypothetical protein
VAAFAPPAAVAHPSCTFTVTAIDNAGNRNDAVEYVVNSTAVEATSGATVPATLALSPRRTSAPSASWPARAPSEC